MKSMIGSCSCYCVKCAKVFLASSVCSIRGSCASCIENIFSSPVLSPCKTCVCINVFAVSKGYIFISCCIYSYCITFIYRRLGKIKGTIFLNNCHSSSSGCCILFFPNFYFGNCFDVCCKLLSCNVCSCCQLQIIFVIYSWLNICFCLKCCADRGIFSVCIRNNNLMLSHFQLVNCYNTIFSFSLYTVYSIRNCKIGRKSSGKLYLKSCIRGFYICCCCCDSSCYRNIGILNIKIDDSLACIVGYTGNGFAHHGYVMR